MIELFAIVCQLSAPAECKGIRLNFAAEPGVALQCQMGLAGQDELAKWRNGNPAWFIKKWKCGPASVMAKA